MSYSSVRRIAYVLRVFPKCSETFIVSELAELRRRGIDLRILSLRAPGDAVRHQLVTQAGLDQIACYDPRRFREILRDFRPQFLHAHFATEATAAAIDLAAELDCPFTFTAHGYDIHRKAPADFGARAATARAVVTVCQANADYLADHFAVNRGHISVIPCGVDTQFFRPADVSVQLDKNGEPPVILCVARLVQVKNLGVLLQACAWLRDRGRQFRCVLLGDGPCRDALEEHRKALGLESLVEMPGAVEQTVVRRWWQQAALGALSSDNEGMPVSLMEAAACGVPAVATAVGGVPELVKVGITGLLVPARDSVALGAALDRLLSDSELRARFSRAAREHAEQNFSVKRQVDQLLALWSGILAAGGANPVFVSDPFNAVTDSDLPTLPLALDPAAAKSELKHHLPGLAAGPAKFRLTAIRVLRHKRGRRCVVEYETIVHPAGADRQKITLIGKTRVRRFGKEGYRLQEKLWQAGFDSQSPDGISVPEPIGVVPRFHMWLQRKVDGPTATRVLPQPAGTALAGRIAEAIYKVHQANVPTERRHSMSDELRILDECLSKVAAIHPAWSGRLQAVLEASRALGDSLPQPRLCGIHRDFYPAQVIVASETSQDTVLHSTHLYLIDFDLYCLGDPGLDVGNFIGHMTEQSLRELGDPRGLSQQEQALEERFLELAGEALRPSVRAYTTLTLVRHIFLSTQAPERRPFTPALLALCEQRLGMRADRTVVHCS